MLVKQLLLLLGSVPAVSGDTPDRLRTHTVESVLRQVQVDLMALFLEGKLDVIVHLLLVVAVECPGRHISLYNAASVLLLHISPLQHG